MDELQRWNQEMFIEVFFGENLCGNFTDIKEPKTVPIASTQSQIYNQKSRPDTSVSIFTNAGKSRRYSNLGSNVPSSPAVVPACGCNA